MPRVLITPVQFRDSDASYFSVLRDAGLEFVFPRSQEYTQDPDALVEELEGIDAVVASTEPYTADVFARSNLRVVARTGVGYDSIDVKAASERNVLVTITPGAVDGSVAEATLALIFAIYRDVVARDREVRSGVWKRRSMPRLAGKTLGIVGFGRIGRAVARLAQGVDLKVIAHDPFADNVSAAKLGVPLVSLEDILRDSHILSLHAPCTEHTANLIRRETLSQMKNDAVLINTGRGGLVNESDLFEAMSGGHLMGAALDVFQQEPTPASNKLLTLPNVIAAPHTAGLDHQSEIDMPRLAFECVAKLFLGQWPEGCVINSELRPTWRWDS